MYVLKVQSYKDEDKSTNALYLYHPPHRLQWSLPRRLQAGRPCVSPWTACITTMARAGTMAAGTAIAMATGRCVP